MSVALISDTKVTIEDVALRLNDYVTALYTARFGKPCGCCENALLDDMSSLVHQDGFNGWEDTLRKGLLTCEFLLNLEDDAESDETLREIRIDANELGVSTH